MKQLGVNREVVRQNCFTEGYETCGTSYQERQLKQRLHTSSKDTWTYFKRKEGFGDFCKNQDVGIKMHCKTAGMPRQVWCLKLCILSHTVKQNSLPHLYPGAKVKKNISTDKPSLPQLLLAKPFKLSCSPKHIKATNSPRL